MNFIKRKPVLLALILTSFLTTGCKNDIILDIDSSLDDNQLPNEEIVIPDNIPSNEWMNYLADTTSISLISMPGTHDSAAYLEKLLASARCQNEDIMYQLNQGIRYFDIRPKATSLEQTDDLPIYHGIVNTEITLATVLNQMSTFLDENPSEMIIYTMRDEDTNDKYQETWKTTIKHLFQNLKDQGKTIDMKPNMRLDECRGKIIFLTRTGSSDYRLDENDSFIGGAQTWKDNRIFDNEIINPQGETVVIGTIEDYYKLAKADDTPTREETIEKKKREITNNILNASTNNDPNHWYVTYTSGYTAFGFLGLADCTPHELACEMNPHTLQFIQTNSCKTGIVVMDYASDEDNCHGISLTEAIINSNFGR